MKCHQKLTQDKGSYILYLIGLNTMKEIRIFESQTRTKLMIQ